MRFLTANDRGLWAGIDPDTHHLEGRVSGRRFGGSLEEACRALRASIYRAREAAHRRACDYRSLHAGHIGHIASMIAAPWAFNRRAGMDELEEVIGILTHLLRAADSLEQLEAPDGA